MMIFITLVEITACLENSDHNLVTSISEEDTPTP